jgi:hypothetical protein
MKAQLLLLPTAALTLMSCGNAGPSTETIAAERAAVAADAAQRQASAIAAPQRDDAAAVAGPATATQQAGPNMAQSRANGGNPRIIRQATRQGRIDPECTVTVGYPDGSQQDILVALGSCEDLTLTLLPVSDLQARGELDDLPDDARRDILRSRSGVVLYSESEFTASAYPQNAAGDAYEVALAD